MSVVVESFGYFANAGTGTSIVIPKPSGLAVGDLMVGLIGNEDAANDANHTSPAGWTKVVEVGDGTVDTHLSVFWKVAEQSDVDATNFTFTWDGSEYGGGWVLRVTGALNSNPIQYFDSIVSSGASLSHPSLTLDAKNYLPFGFWGFDGADGAPFSLSSFNGWPASYNDANQELVTGGGGQGWSGGWRNYPNEVTGSVGYSDISCQANDGNIGLTFAIEAKIDIEQEGFQFINDDGSESAATQAQNQDTNHTVAANNNTRIRMLTNLGNANTSSVTLQYKRTDEAVTEWRNV